MAGGFHQLILNAFSHLRVLHFSFPGNASKLSETSEQNCTESGIRNMSTNNNFKFKQAIYLHATNHVKDQIGILIVNVD